MLFAKSSLIGNTQEKLLIEISFNNTRFYSMFYSLLKK